MLIIKFKNHDYTKIESITRETPGGQGEKGVDGKRRGGAYSALTRRKMK